MAPKCETVRHPENPQLPKNLFDVLPPDIVALQDQLAKLSERVKQKRQQVPLAEFLKYLDEVLEGLKKTRDVEKRRAGSYLLQQYINNFSQYRDQLSACSSQRPAGVEELETPDVEGLPRLNNNGHVSILVSGGKEGVLDSTKQVLYDPATGKLAVVTILRDTLVDGEHRLHAATGQNAQTMERQVERLTGESVEYYMRLDLETVSKVGDELIKIIGPIEINLPHSYVADYNFSFFPKRTVIRSGDELLTFLRFRSGWIVKDNYPFKGKVMNRAWVNPKPNPAYIVKQVTDADKGRTERQTTLMGVITGKLKAKLSEPPKTFAEKAIAKTAGLAGEKAARVAVFIKRYGTSVYAIFDLLKSTTNIGYDEIPNFLALMDNIKSKGGKPQVVDIRATTRAVHHTEKGPLHGVYKGEVLDDPDSYKKQLAAAMPPRKK